jgi:hypothetical protein
VNPAGKRALRLEKADPAVVRSQIHDPTRETTGFEIQQRWLNVKQKLFDRFRMGHDGFEYWDLRVIRGQQTGQDLEFSKI